jgi:preprotein translocase SecE subunit
MKFIYDSLDTVKKLKRPTKKDFINLTLAIFALVIVAGVYFVATDTVFSGIYKWFYSVMK